MLLLPLLLLRVTMHIAPTSKIGGGHHAAAILRG
jgi:hypothetical protein